MSEQKPKRKRRTKAQIEADKKKQEAAKPKVQKPKPAKGVGDMVEDVLTATGVKAFVEFLNGGKECEGCAKRRDWLNKNMRKALPMTIEEVQFLQTINGKSSLGASQVIQLYKVHARVYQYKYRVPGNCGSCTKRKYDDLQNLLKAYKDEK